MKNKIIDLFCGCGGLSLGFEQAGFEVAYAIDMWQAAINTYNHNHNGQVAECRDIHELTKEKLQELKKSGEIVGVIGGPPCQGFSKVEHEMSMTHVIICTWSIAGLLKKYLLTSLYLRM